MDGKRLIFLLLSTTCILSLQIQIAEGQVTETIGFGQFIDSAQEGETQIVRVRLEPSSVSENITGRIVPLTVEQFENYTFTTPRTIPDSVQEAIDAITDPAEYENTTGGRRDFDNTIIEFEILTGDDTYEIQIGNIISEDDVNEDLEQFILVLEFESNEVVFEGTSRGILIVTILDNNAIFLNFNPTVFMFTESNGMVENIITIEKETGPPYAEVDIPVQVMTVSGTATAGTDVDVGTSFNMTYTIPVNDMNVTVSAITIIDDTSPETDEVFTLSLTKGSETLNIFTRESVVTITIQDNDVAQIGFTSSVYSVTEGESPSVQVCITLTDDGQSLDTSSAVGNFSVVVTTPPMMDDSDYSTMPVPSVLTIQQGQETACANITIHDDITIEMVEEFNISLVMENHTFSAGVNLTLDTATVQIMDDDGAVVGFEMGNYTGVEGEVVEVCVAILSPNQTVLDMSSVRGEFSIGYATENGDTVVNVTTVVLEPTTPRECFNVSLFSDGLVEGAETVTLNVTLDTNVFSIRDVTPNTTDIIIIDQDVATIGFMQPTYEINELSNQDTVVPVCVQLSSGNVAPDFSITYSLEFDTSGATQDVTLGSMTGSITNGVTSVYHNVTVSQNDLVEPNGIVYLRINNTSVYPANTIVNISEAEITIINDDSLTVSVEISTEIIPEGGSATLTVSYTGNLHQSYTVNAVITITPDTASGATGDDYDLGFGSPHTSTLSTSNLMDEFVIIAVDDTILENDEERFSISITVNDPVVLAEVDSSRSQVDVTITDNEVLMFSFEEASFEFTEAITGAHTVYVEIENYNSVDIPSGVSIRISALVGALSNATQDLDYSILRNDLEFRSNTPEVGLDISIDIMHDLLVEGLEVVYLSLTQPVIIGLTSDGAVIGSHQNAIIFIRDDDVINVGFNSTNHTGVEGDMIEVCVAIFDGILGPGIVLDYVITAPANMPDGSQPDTAIGPSEPSLDDGDYAMTNRRVQLSANTTFRCVQILLIDDTIVEIEEVFQIQVEQVVSSDDLVFGLNPEFAEVFIVDNDEIMMGFELSEYSFNESAGSLPASVYIVRENPVTVSSNFSVIVVLQNDSTATYDSDFSVPGNFNVTIYFGGHDDRQPFPLDILGDEIGEGDETVELLLTTPGDLDGVRPGTNSTTRIIITEDDFIEYRYTQTEYSFTETATTTRVCLEMVSGFFPPGGYLTVELYTSPITASSGIDYNALLDPISITLRSDTKLDCANVSIIEDDLVEGRELFEVYFLIDDFDGSYSLIGSNSTIVTILDSNVAEVGFQSAMYTVVEGEEEAVTVCVSVLSGNLTDVVSLDYTLLVLQMTAAENEDYSPIVTPINATLTLANSTTCHTLPIYDDEEVEPPEIFLVRISPTGPSPEFINLFNLTVPDTVVQIIDNDSLTIGFESMAYTISEDEASVELCLMFRGPLKNDSIVELGITLLSDSADVLDYTDPSEPDVLTLDVNNTRKCFSVNITNDNIVEGTELFYAEFNETDNNEIMIAGMSRVTIYIEDNERIQLAFESPNYTFSENTSVNEAVVRIIIENYSSLDIRNDVSVTVMAFPGTTNASQNDYEIIQSNNQVRIVSGSQSAEFQLLLEDDDIVEGVERVTLIMSGADITEIDEDAVDTAGEETVVFIEDNDVVSIGFTSTSYFTAEGLVSVCVSVQSGDLQNGVLVNYAISVVNTTATADDFIPLSEEGQVQASSPQFCHNITIVDDDLVEPLEQLQVNLLPLYNVPAVLLSPNTTIINIVDEDAVKVGFEMADYSIEEAQNTPAITIRLIREDTLTSTRDFIVSLSLSTSSTAKFGDDFTIAGGISQMITFGRLESTKEINVTSVHDNVGEGDELIVLEVISYTGNDISVESDRNTTQITIVEDDMILVSFTETRYSVSEGSVVDVCVRIESGILPPDGFVDFTVSTISTTATGTADYMTDAVPSSGTLNETISTTCFTIITMPDTIVEGSEELDVTFTFTDQFGSFTYSTGGERTTVVIVDNDYFELGFEFSSYEVGEGSKTVNDTVYIVKMNDNILQINYDLTIDVIHSIGPFPAVLDTDFEVESPPPLSVIFDTTFTRIPVSFTLLDDVIEEGYENFTLRLSYNEPDPDGTVNIVVETASVSIKDDDVVVIGFEQMAYVVFEGQDTEVCVSILDRELTNDEEREFTVFTSELSDNFAIGNSDYHNILGITTFISSSTVTRRCFMIETIDDEEEEQPEKFGMTGLAVSHLIEFNPETVLIWIVDDDSLLLPVPTISSFNCTPVIRDTTLTVTCIPSSDSVVAELLCSVDGEPLTLCGGSSRVVRDIEPQIVTVDLLDYQDGLHVLEIVGLTQVAEILRDTVEFYGLAQPFKLECEDQVSESGLITITCSSERVLESLTCAVDGGTPKQCALKFVIDLSSYDKGPHTIVVTATNLLGEVDTYTTTFESTETAAVSVWDDREFVAAVAIAGVAIIILLLLMLAICLLVFYHRKVNKLNKYSLDIRSENEYVGIERNLSYREHEPVELVDYTPRHPSASAAQPPRHNRPSSQQSYSSTARPQSQLSQQSQASPAHPQSQQSQASSAHPQSQQSDASTVRIMSHPPRSSASKQLHSPPADTSVPQSPQKPLSQDSATEEQTEQQLLLATGGGEGHGLKISRRHSVETGKETKMHRHLEEEAARGGSFGGVEMGKGAQRGAYSIQQGKELRGKEWEDEMERELQRELEKDRERDRVRARERRREIEQRERRREREQRSRDHRARERKDREKEREVARERRLAHDHDSHDQPDKGSSHDAVVHESPESFL